MPDVSRNSMTGEVVTPLGRVALRPAGEYQSGQTYDRLDLVRYNGSGWICLKDGTATDPVDGADWMLYVEQGDSGNATLAQSWAEGGTGVRPGEDTNNAKYFSEQAKSGAASSNDSANISSESASSAQLSKNAAESAQNAAEQAAGKAEEFSTTASEKAREAFDNAEKAQQYSGKPPVIQNGYWWIWDADAQQYTDTGKRAVLNYDVSYPSVEAMIADKENQKINTVAVVSSSIEEEYNGKVYIMDDTDENGWRFLANLSGGSYIEIDPTPTKGSENAVSSGGVYDALEQKQDTLTGNAGQLIGIGDNGAAYATVYQSNPNILDNCYFIGGGSQQGGGQFPINQRGKTEYVGSNVYMIDRWTQTANNRPRFKGVVEPNGLRIDVTQESSRCYFVQKFEKSSICQGTYTLSMLFDNTLISEVFSIPSEGIEGDEINGVKLQIANEDNNIVRFGGIVQPGFSVLFKAAKLELGDRQTLAHQDEKGNWVLNDPAPNYALELAKCHRYFYCAGFGPNEKIGGDYAIVCSPFIFNSGENRYVSVVDLPVTMRATPTLTVYSWDATENNIYISAKGNVPVSRIYARDNTAYIATTDSKANNVSGLFAIIADAEL